MESFESHSGIESFEDSNLQKIYEDLQNVFIMEVLSSGGDMVGWLNSPAGEFLPEVFSDYVRENPNFENDWNNLNKREDLIREIRNRIDSTYSDKYGDLPMAA